ncbi:MAG: hypothetical protein OXE96_06730 [Gemmatimonadetes bacterium]|nr:hypothetical protein [Gemmatimonadota bacterium]
MTQSRNSPRVRRCSPYIHRRHTWARAAGVTFMADPVEIFDEQGLLVGIAHGSAFALTGHFR